jgi:hypothetical protein
MYIDLDGIFCEIDDFCQIFEKEWKNKPCLQETQETQEEIFSLLASEMRNSLDNSVLLMSEIMTIIVAFHISNYRTFKHFYIKHVQIFWKDAFPNLVSYPRFVALQKSVVIPLCIYLNQRQLFSLKQ